MQLAIDLPPSAFEHLSRLAQLTNQSVADLVVQSITGNLPPTVETAPVEVQPELLALQTLSVDQLRQVAQGQVPHEQQVRQMALLAQNQEDRLTAAEQAELQKLMLAADQLMLKKAHACAVLRWRGQPIRNLSQLAG
ncbi:MAG: hypothetical protein AAGG51_26345 [Cyanobacteria bacterium P01_G01_bin.54]